MVARASNTSSGKVSAEAAKKTLSFMANAANSINKTLSMPDHELLSTPLFELATLTPTEKQVNVQKLKTFLSLHGEFHGTILTLIVDCLSRNRRIPDEISTSHLAVFVEASREQRGIH